MKPRIIKVCDIESADLLLLSFCKEFQRLYGSSACTPNIHLHTHLKECVLDYGPPHAFWCYPFERYNGILGQYHTNRRSIESQLMKKFIHSQAYTNANILSNEFNEFLSGGGRTKQNQDHANDGNISLMPTMSIHLIDSFAGGPKSVVKPLKPYKVKALSSEHCEQLNLLYGQLHQRQYLMYPIFTINMVESQLKKELSVLKCQAPITIHRLQ